MNLISNLYKYFYLIYLRSNNKIVRKIIRKIHLILLKFFDPIITVSFNNVTLTMPFSHTIFINQKNFPNYDMQLKKIIAYLYKLGGGGTYY